MFDVEIYKVFLNVQKLLFPFTLYLETSFLENYNYRNVKDERCFSCFILFLFLILLLSHTLPGEIEIFIKGVGCT